MVFVNFKRLSATFLPQARYLLLFKNRKKDVAKILYSTDFMP